MRSRNPVGMMALSILMLTSVATAQDEPEAEDASAEAQANNPLASFVAFN